GHWLRSTDAGLVAGHREQHESGFGAWNHQLDPALRTEDLVGGHFEAALLCPERECCILIFHWHTHKLNSANHRFKPPSGNNSAAIPVCTIVQSSLYSLSVQLRCNRSRWTITSSTRCCATLRATTGSRRRFSSICGSLASRRAKDLRLRSA